MVARDLHSKAFDESTLTKLRIFKNYLKNWLPTFIAQKHVSVINIFDLFAGPGFDKNKEKGSPIIILDCLLDYISLINNYPTKINIYLNEFISEKYKNLCSNCMSHLNNNPILNKYVSIFYYNKDFNIIFQEIQPFLNLQIPNILFLDQNGIKHLSETNFTNLIQYTKTDFLYFISSSYLRRFGKNEAFLKHLNINIDELKNEPYKLIHNNILEYYKSLIPVNNDYMLYPYSLKKGSNIYGLIFGTSNIRGVDKFLNVSWKENPINGNANFDIDDDLNAGQVDIFSGKPRKTKIEIFQQKLQDAILAKQLTTNIDVYYYTLANGHIPIHAVGEIRRLKIEKIINYSGKPLISYSALKNKKIIQFDILKDYEKNKN